MEPERLGSLKLPPIPPVRIRGADAFFPSDELAPPRNTPLAEKGDDRPRHVIELASELVAGGSATANIRQHRDGTWISTSVQITVWDVITGIHGPAGRFGIAFFDTQSKLWIVEQLQCG